MKNLLFITLSCLLIQPLWAQKNTSPPGPSPFAGTYLSVDTDAAHILQLSADGNLTFIMSWQFDNEGVIGESYSNTKGNWKRKGPKTITAGTADIAFKDGVFIGVARAHYNIQFEKGYQIAHLTCSGALYPPGVNPLDKAAEPVSGSAFTCGDPIRFERLPAE